MIDFDKIVFPQKFLSENIGSEESHLIFSSFVEIENLVYIFHFILFIHYTLFNNFVNIVVFI